MTTFIHALLFAAGIVLLGGATLHEDWFMAILQGMIGLTALLIVLIPIWKEGED